MAFMSITLVLPAMPLLSHTGEAGDMTVGAMKDTEKNVTGK